jgi:hypothetical protein
MAESGTTRFHLIVEAREQGATEPAAPERPLATNHHRRLDQDFVT